jgi:DNA-directed RNA polymerase specialized sigma subunit
MSRKQPEHYVDNKEFLRYMMAFKEETKIAREDGDPDPRVPDDIGKIFMSIANRLSYKSNFINYAFREDMISDGIENCIQYIHNFNPEKSKNPFAYFTQIIYYAFLRRIQKEKKQLYVKYKSLENSQIMDNLNEASATGPSNSSLLSQEQTNISSIGFAKLYDNMSEFIGTFEDSIQKKKDIKNKKRTQTDGVAPTAKKKRPVSANNLLQYATNVKPEDV